MVQIAPSMLAADFLHLEKDVEMVNEYADLFHLDIMDGVFVPNLSYGVPVVEAIAKMARKPLDTHLMICDPIRYVERFAKAGAEYITFHYEAAENIDACIDAIHAAGAKAGISIKPATDVEVLSPWLSKVEMVLIMSVEPGFGGQSFMPASLDKVRALRKEIEDKGYNCLIEIDGGISAKNAKVVFDAGCDAVVAGSAVFSAPNPEQAIIDILNA